MAACATTTSTATGMAGTTAVIGAADPTGTATTQVGTAARVGTATITLADRDGTTTIRDLADGTGNLSNH